MFKIGDTVKSGKQVGVIVELNEITACILVKLNGYENYIYVPVEKLKPDKSHKKSE